MADDEIPTMVDGLTPMERRTVIRILKDQVVVKDFSHYYGGGDRKQQNLVVTENYADITLVHPRYVFHPSDEPLLTYFMMDYLRGGKDMQEPAWLMPVIPIVLINGAMGRKYNPWDVIAYFRRRLLKDKQEPVLVRPWIDDGEKTETSLGRRAAKEGFLMKKARSTTDLETLLLDKEGGKIKYDTLEEVLEEFFTLRLKSYKERMSAMQEVIESAVYELETEASTHDGEYFDSKEMVLDYSLKEEVLYAETKNHLLRSTGCRMLDIELGSDHQSTTWWRQILRAFDVFEDRISPKLLWLNDLDAFEEQLDEQYKKQEPSEVQDKDEPKMWKKRIWVSDSESGEEDDDSGDDEE